LLERTKSKPSEPLSRHPFLPIRLGALAPRPPVSLAPLLTGAKSDCRRHLNVVDPAAHHLFFTWFSPANRPRRIRIRAVLLTIIEVKRKDQPRSFWYKNGVLQLIL